MYQTRLDFCCFVWVSCFVPWQANFLAHNVATWVSLLSLNCPFVKAEIIWPLGIL